MGDINIAHRASAAVTITLSGGLASSSDFSAGQESALVDNSTNKDVDGILAGKITVGTSPTTDREIRVYVVAPRDDTPNWPDVMDGTDSVETWTSAAVRDGVAKLAAQMLTNNTSDRTYHFHCGSIAALFGGVMPLKFVVFVTHNTGVNLHTTSSNHEIKYTGVRYTVA